MQISDNAVLFPSQTLIDFSNPQEVEETLNNDHHNPTLAPSPRSPTSSSKIRPPSIPQDITRPLSFQPSPRSLPKLPGESFEVTKSEVVEEQSTASGLIAGNMRSTLEELLIDDVSGSKQDSRAHPYAHCPVIDHMTVKIQPDVDTEARTLSTSVKFLKGSVTESVVATLEERRFEIPPELEKGACPHGPVIYLGPHPQKFHKFATVSLSVSAMGARVRLLHSSTSDCTALIWKDITDDPRYNVSISHSKISFTTDHFSWYWLRIIIKQAISIPCYYLHFQCPLTLSIFFRKDADETAGVLRFVVSISNTSPAPSSEESEYTPVASEDGFCYLGDRIRMVTGSSTFKFSCLLEGESSNEWKASFDVNAYGERYPFERSVSPTEKSTEADKSDAEYIHCSGEVRITRELTRGALASSSALRKVFYVSQFMRDAIIRRTNGLFVWWLHLAWNFKLRATKKTCVSFAIVTSSSLAVEHF